MRSLLFLSICLGLALECTSGYMDISSQTALQIRRNMNRSANPCTDFWNYACGGFRNSSNYVDNFEWVEDLYATSMGEFFESHVEDTQSPRLLEQMKTYYKACTTDPLYWTLDDIPESLRDWQPTLDSSRGYGLNGVFFDERVDVATNDSLQLVVQIQMPQITTRYSMQRILRIIQKYPWEHKHQMNQLAVNIRMLEYKYCLPEPIVQTWRVEELSRHIPQVPWTAIIRDILGEDPGQLENLLFEVSDVDYLREMGQLLANTDPGTLNQYLKVRQLILLKETEPLSRNPKSCIHHMRALLPLGMDYIYDKFLYKNRKADTLKLQEILRSLKATFGKYLDANRLGVTSDQMAYLRAKLHGMKIKIGNLPEDESFEFYDNHYQSANFTESSFLKNLNEALALRTRLQHEGLLQPGSRLDLRRYYVNDDVVKARTSPFYENERNTITVPMLFLQWPLFDHRQHAIFHGSLLEAVLAHEMSHGFEQEGILFDADGNESPIGLEIRESPAFQNAIKCVQRQPFVSLKERLADLNGLQLAYDAFFDLNHDSRKFEYRPYAFEAEFSAPQLFFLSYAQFFCGLLPPVIAHDRDDERVNVSVGNLRQFAYDFKCEPSTVQSHPICEMWRPPPREEYRSG
ncbi:hypothetical protein KR074_004484 [Drosophila pseudoananassae]|nr:hypothetical protein KR074_004484 [Drosophila pseudoananassae]